MINKGYEQLGKVRSSIRELFEYGNRRRAEIGADNVFDFSLGNPSVPPPEIVGHTLKELINNTDPVKLHGYTSAQGAPEVRGAIAEYIRKTFGANVTADEIYMTCGAAAALTITLCALCNRGDEVIVFAPYFPEYKVFAEQAGATLKVIPARECDFGLNLEELASALSPNVKAVIINSPNNPSGVVYSQEQIEALCKLLAEYAATNGTRIYLISDEPYRELVYDGVKVPYIMNEYADSIVCYSFSKSLSLPGERIGYIAVNRDMADFADVYAAVCGAGRSLGYVCAPNIMQQLAARVVGATSDISVYKANRDALCNALSQYGFKVVKPQGAFYLFVKAPEGDAAEFAERAKRYELLIVSGDSFGCNGYARISYCVSPDTIARSLPAFKALAKSYKLC